MINLHTLPVDVSSQIVMFRDFLNSSWACLDNLMRDHDWDDDGRFSDEWVQVNWEFLVERELLANQGYLPPFDLINRITNPCAKATYKIICTVNKDVSLIDWIKKTDNYADDELLLTGFCTPVKGTFGLYPPFDYVRLRTADRKKIYTVPLLECHFYLVQINEP